MSDFNEAADEANYERMHELDEYAPACVEPVEDYRRYQIASQVGVRRGTYDELQNMKISEGLCPFPGCTGTLDEDYFCSFCSNVSLPRVPKDALPKKEAA